MFKKVVALFTLVSFLLVACNDPSSGQTENENEKSVETTTTVQDESQQDKDLETETSQTIGEGNVKAEYRVDKENWSFKPIGDANPKVVL